MAVESVPMEEAGMLSSIMAEGTDPEVTRETVEPEPKAPEKTEDRARDDSGRFVAKTEEPAKADPAQTEQPAATKDEQAEIPSWRLREMREERDAARQNAEKAAQEAHQYRQEMAELRRQIEASKPKAEPTDFFQNPEVAINERLAPVQSDIEKFKNDMRLEFSRELAVIKHGPETVAEVEAAIGKAMQAGNPEMATLSAQMRQSSNPVALAIQWHQRNKLMETTGGNLETYKQKVLEEAMKDPAFQAKMLEATRAQATTRPSTIQIPPSLNKAAGSGVSQSDVDATDMSDASLFRHAMSGGRR